MADIEGFLREINSTFPSGEPDLAARRPPFDEILADVGGMATPPKLELLHIAARYLGQGEVYLEAGTFRGASIIAASEGNAGAFVAVDDFSQFAGSLDQARANIERYRRSNVELRDGSIWAELNRWDGPPVGVYFYDANHRFLDQWYALERAIPILADRAIVLIDDMRFPAVQRATDAFLRAHPGFCELARFSSPYNGEPRWWNGISVLAFSRGPSSSKLALTRGRLRGLWQYVTAEPRLVAELSTHSLYLRLPESIRARVRSVRGKS